MGKSIQKTFRKSHSRPGCCSHVGDWPQTCSLSSMEKGKSLQGWPWGQPSAVWMHAAVRWEWWLESVASPGYILLFPLSTLYPTLVL